MPLRICIALTAFALLAADDEKEERDRLAKLDLIRLQGTWELVSLEEGGKPAPAKDAKAAPAKEGKGVTLTFGADVFVVREGEALRQFGVLKLDPTKSPKIANATVLGGEGRGTTMLGIYELKGDELRVAFDPEGIDRPKDFKVEPEGKQFLAEYRRRKPSPGREEITGRYTTRATAIGAPDMEGEAEIQRLGESYLVRYFHEGRAAYVGIGIRTGDTLSVCWTNRAEVGVSVYRIGKDKKLIGNYSKLGGAGVLNREELTPKAVID